MRTGAGNWEDEGVSPRRHRRHLTPEQERRRRQAQTVVLFLIGIVAVALVYGAMAHR